MGVRHIWQTESNLGKMDESTVIPQSTSDPHCCLEASVDHVRPGVLSPKENRIGFALYVGKDIDAQIVCWTDQIVESHEERSPLW
jgi:hypothetical protein